MIARKRGQASIELISVLSVALLVLGIIIAASRASFEDMQSSLDTQMAEHSLRELAMISEKVYNSGPGSMQKTVLHIPTSVVSEESSLSDNLINIRISHKYGIKDIPQPLPVPARSDLTFLPGDYEVYIVAHSGYVFITENPSILLSETLLYIPQGKEYTIKVKNPGAKDTVITALPDPGITLSWTSKPLNAGGEAELTLSAISSGTVKLTSSSGEYETITMKVQ